MTDRFNTPSNSLPTFIMSLKKYPGDILNRNMQSERTYVEGGWAVLYELSVCMPYTLFSHCPIAWSK